MTEAGQTWVLEEVGPIDFPRRTVKQCAVCVLTRLRDDDVWFGVIVDGDDFLVHPEEIGSERLIDLKSHIVEGQERMVEGSALRWRRVA